MDTIDFSKPVKYKDPQPGEENLVFIVTNFNEVTNRCYIDALNLPGFENGIRPSFLISADDIVNIETD